MENKDKNNIKIGRRNFLKVLGAGSVVTSSALIGCKPDNKVSAEGGSLGEVPTDKMTYRINPHTGDKVSLLGYGCMRWPLRKNSAGEDEIDQDATNELVDYALAHGVNYFDTAPPYIRGWSEKATGIALKRHPRDKYFIATKLSNMSNNPGLRSKQGCIDLYHKSLENLQTDYIDYYLLHTVGSNGYDNFLDRFINNGIIDFLLKEREAGRIRNLGFSFHGDVKAFDHLLAMDIQWDFAMIQLNYIDWKYASGQNIRAQYLYEELVKHNVPVIIMEPLLGGRLARLNTLWLSKLKQLRPEDSPANWAFRYAGTPENVLTVLSGMTYKEHLQENIKAYSPLDPVTQEEHGVLEVIAKQMMESDFIQCTECQYCMPCPYGIDIPSVFAHYNRCVNDGKIVESSKHENYREARRAFLIGYDRSVPKLRQANHCIGCNTCRPRCPQGINIPKEMRRIDAYTEQLKQNKDF